MRVASATVRAVNGLTTRWAGDSEDGTVFSAAGVMPVPAGGRPQYRYETTVVRTAFDRPFGFLAVHRETGIVLVAGWVTDPTPYAAPGFTGTLAPGR